MKTKSLLTILIITIALIMVLCSFSYGLIYDAKDELVRMVENKEIPFDFSYINNYILKYFDQIFEKSE